MFWQRYKKTDIVILRLDSDKWNAADFKNHKVSEIYPSLDSLRDALRSKEIKWRSEVI